MRDGEQSPGFAMTMEQKLFIAQILDSIGIYQIEAGIPAVGRYEMETMGLIMQNRKNSKISVWNRLMLADIKKSIACRPDIIHVSVPVSYAMIYSKLNKNKTWVTKNLAVCVAYALEKGFEVTVGFEDASRADITFMIVLAQQLKELGVSRIRFADTVGVLSPARTYQAVRDIIGNAGIEVEIHAHNDLGMAVANSVAGAKAGADYIDTTVFGIGERAGNCDFLRLIHAARDIFRIHVTRSEALRIQDKVAETLLMPQTDVLIKKGNSFG